MTITHNVITDHMSAVVDIEKSWVYLLAFILVFSAALISHAKAHKKTPGPSKIPFIGNAHKISPRYPWKQFQQWNQTFGPIFQLQLWQNTVFIIGDHSTAKSILTKRSSNYSSRPRLIVAGECVGNSLDTALLPYGPRWKAFHAVHTSLLGARRSQLYRPLQELESSKLLLNLLSSNRFEDELYRYSASLIFTLLYGKGFATGLEDDLQEIAHLASSVFEATATGKWLVEKLPILDYLPRPFRKWKTVGDKLHSQQKDIYNRHFAAAQETSSWNWVQQILSKPPPNVTQAELPFVIGELFGAGSRTTAGCLAVAIQASVTHPRAQQCVQEELDKQVGSTRLPVFEDISQLPYLRAFINEMLRWRPLTPSGVAHAPLKDDVYDGFRISAGSIVIANHWSLDHDPKIFSQPDDFVPERWLEKGDLPLAAWGFGKRMCPGQHLASNSLMLVVARLLWAFNVKWKEGQSIQPEDIEMTHEGLFSRPGPFEVVFEPRSQQHREVVLRQDIPDVDDLLEKIGRAYGAL